METDISFVCLFDNVFVTYQWQATALAHKCLVWDETMLAYSNRGSWDREEATVIGGGSRIFSLPISYDIFVVPSSLPSLYRGPPWRGRHLYDSAYVPQELFCDMYCRQSWIPRSEKACRNAQRTLQYADYESTYDEILLFNPRTDGVSSQPRTGSSGLMKAPPPFMIPGTTHRTYKQ